MIKNNWPSFDIFFIFIMVFNSYYHINYSSPLQVTDMDMAKKDLVMGPYMSLLLITTLLLDITQVSFGYQRDADSLICKNNNNMEKS